MADQAAKLIHPQSPSMVMVDGCEVHFTRHGTQIGTQNRPSLILLHCGGGHAGWWAGVTPELSANFEVITVDLSGHGMSGHRDAYTPERWATEISEIAKQASSFPPTLVGHSMGGLAAIYGAALYPQAVGRLILIDPPVQDVFIRESPPSSRIYEKPEDALGRFKLRPPETIADAALLETVAQAGLKPVQGGWSWRYDTRASQRFSVEGVDQMLAKIICPVGCIYGEKSQYVNAGTVRHIEKLLRCPVPAYVILGAFHHIPLDAPQLLAEAIGKMEHALQNEAGS